MCILGQKCWRYVWSVVDVHDLFLLSDVGNWSSDGCKTDSRERNIVVCKCNHLSSFAVLAVSCNIRYLSQVAGV